MNWKIIISKRNKYRFMDYKKAHDIIKNQCNENDKVTIKKIDRLKISNTMKLIIKILSFLI